MNKSPKIRLYEWVLYTDKLIDKESSYECFDALMPTIPDELMIPQIMITVTED